MNLTEKTLQSEQHIILKDPVAYFEKHFHSPENIEILIKIKTLSKQHQTTQQEIIKLQEQAGKTSREIGKAKRSNINAEKALNQMKSISHELKLVKSKSKAITQNIIDCFISLADKSPDKDNEESNFFQVQHAYKDKSSINENIIVSEFLLSSDESIHINEWNTYVNQSKNAGIHHRTEWKKIHSDSHGHKSLYLCARNEKNIIVGIMPLVHINSRLFSNTLVSMPYFQQGGAIGDSKHIEYLLIKEAINYANKLNIDHLEMRDDIPLKHSQLSLPVQTHKVNMVLALANNKNELWHSFSSKLRAQIRRAGRENPQTLFGHIELIDDFYQVYSRNMRDLGSPVQSKNFIKNILLSFPDNSWLVIVKLKNKTVAAGLLLSNDGLLEIPLASTIREANRYSINMHLYWSILEFACNKGFKHFDFGRSSIDGSTYRFKKQWGAKPKKLYWHYYLSNTKEMPSLNPSNPKYALVISIWKRLPVKLTQWIGPPLVKNIP